MAKNLQAGLRQSIQASRKASLSGGNVFGSSPLDLRFALQKTLDPRVTFTRASTGTYVGSNNENFLLTEDSFALMYEDSTFINQEVSSSGLLQSATTNEARFDHNPTTGESLGLLVEEARTNLALRSEEFSDVTWLKPGGTTCSANVVTAPDGTTTADKLVEFNGNVNQSFEQANTLVLGTAYSISIYAKAAERIQFRLAGRTSANWVVFPSGRFDLSTGTVLNSSGDKTATISAVGDGWYRCTIYGTSAGTNAGIIVSPLLTGGTASSYAGDGTSGIYLWGAQLEAGAFLTSYIPTTTAAATRAADVASITGANFSSWYNQAEGTVFADASVAYSAAISLFSLDDSTTNNRIQLRNSNLAADIRVVTAGASQATLLTSNTTAVNIRARHASAYKLNDLAVTLNSGTVATQSTALLPVATQATFTTAPGSAATNATIRRLTFWPVRLANPTLVSITAP